MFLFLLDFPSCQTAEINQIPDFFANFIVYFAALNQADEDIAL